MGHLVMPMGREAVRIRPQGRDEYGDPLEGEDRIPLDLIGVAPRSGGPGTNSTDVHGRGREGVIIGLTAYLEAGSDVAHTDLIEIDGVTYEVEGDPGDWQSPFSGWRPGMEVALRKAEG